ncbi:MlaC/ttg2D family ABC transporter substrate-binding protein [Lichenicoccus sp.]|uniref:MlaC/ttg2D family ABC transporter substrate-binding protein n=1 Tax=Lichenicoccus sp. TaxID=2781899 RepID=UPI003D13AB00
MPTTLTRRHALALIGATIILATPLSSAMAQQGGSDADFIRRLAAKMTAILNSSAPMVQKQHQLLPLIDDYIDVSGIARFSLSHYWHAATPAQQQQFMTLFHRVLFNNILGKMGQFKGVALDVEGTTPHGPGSSVVNTRITRPGQPPLAAQWVVSQVDGKQKITDVIGEGVSLKITERGDYTSYLGRHGGSIAELLKAMERQAAHQS